MLCAAGSARAAYWHTDFGEAQRKAFGENRIILVHFMSSDRGGIYDRFQKEVFSKYEFQVFADRRLVLVEVDFPRWKRLHPTQVKINRELADKYGGHAWPIVVLVNNRGERLGRITYREGGAEPFIKEIERITKLSDKDKPGAPAVEPPPLFSGAPTGPAPKYSQLTLKSISGTGAKRLALINNATLAAGETGKVLLGGGEVKIRCDEIREASVIVTVEGKGKRELRLFPVEEISAPRQAHVK
jgi:hypothetical protein